MAFFGGFGGALRGAGIGGALGFMGSEDRVGGLLGGMAGGAVAGMFGPWAGRQMMGGRGINFAGGMRTALGMGIKGAKAARGGFQRIAANSLTRGAGYGGIAAGFGADITRMAGYGLAGARNYIGRNSVMTNKIGGTALAAIGVASMANLGATVLSSNRGYR